MTGRQLRRIVAGFLIALLPAAIRAGVPEIERDRGSIVVLNFWATWCLPCLAEMPDLARVHERFGGRRVIVHGAAADGPERRAEVDRFVAASGIGFPIGLGATTDDMERFGLGDTLPATVVLDRDGSVAGRVRGGVDRASLESFLEWLLGDRAGPAPALRAAEAGHEEPASGHEEKGEDEGVSRVPS